MAEKELSLRVATSVYRAERYGLWNSTVAMDNAWRSQHIMVSFHHFYRDTSSRH